MAAEAVVGFAGEGPERQQTAGPAEEKEGEPGMEHRTCLAEEATAGWWGLSSLCWGLEAGSRRKRIKEGENMFKSRPKTVLKPMTTQ